MLSFPPTLKSGWFEIWNCLFFMNANDCLCLCLWSTGGRLVLFRPPSSYPSSLSSLLFPWPLKMIQIWRTNLLHNRGVAINFRWQRLSWNVALMIRSCCVLCSASHAINNCCPASCSAEIISMEFTSLVTCHLISLEFNSGTVLFIYSWNMVYIILMLM